MEVIYLLLIVGATLCFAVSAFATGRAVSVNDPRPASRVNLVPLGLMLWILVALIKLLADLIG